MANRLPGHIVETLPDSERRCRGGCGFYGNEAWGGYCSHCHTAQKGVQPARNMSSGGLAISEEVEGEDERAATSQSSASSPSRPDRFSDSLSSSQSISVLFSSRKPAHKRSNSMPGESETATKADGAKAGEAKEEPIRKNAADVNFLKSLKPTAAQDVTQQIKTLLFQFNDARNTTQEARSKLIQTFYSSMLDRIDTQPIWHGAVADEQGKLRVLDGVARLLLPQIYDRIFFCDPSEKEADIALHSRIQQLAWVDEKCLEAQIDSANSEAMSFFSAAQNELIIMDGKRNTQDKLTCIHNCCKTLFRVLEISAGAQAKPSSADDLLPMLIYTVLRANPPFFKANLQFISNYSPQHQLHSGEAAYYYTNLYGALSFLENINASHLHLTEAEFTARMTTSSLSNPATVHLNNSRNNIERLQRLLERQRRLQGDIDALSEVIDGLVHIATADAAVANSA